MYLHIEEQIQKSECSHIRDKKSLFLWIFSENLRISNFEMWICDVIFDSFSEKVTCNSKVNCIQSKAQIFNFHNSVVNNNASLALKTSSPTEIR